MKPRNRTARRAIARRAFPFFAPWIFAALADAPAAAVDETGPLVALVGPMTGLYADYGRQMRLGFAAAIEDTNAAGGISGKQLRPVIADDACDPAMAVEQAHRMVRERAAVVIGHFCSGVSIAAARIYADAGIVQISPGANHPNLTDERAGPNVFRVSGREDRQGEVAGQYLASNFNGKKVAIIHDKSAYGKGLADETQKAMNKAGLKEAMYEAYTAGEKDYTALVAKLEAASIDVVYVGGYPKEASLIVRKMRDQGLSSLLVAGDALMTQEYWQIAGKAGEGTLMTFSPDPRKEAAAAAVVKRFRAKKIEPEGYVLYTYAAIQTWAQAAGAAKSGDSKMVIEELNKGTFKTVVGNFKFDNKGDPNLPPYKFYVWKDGNYDQIN